VTGAGEDLEPGPGSRAAAASGLSHTMTDTRSPFLRPTAPVCGDQTLGRPRSTEPPL